MDPNKKSDLENLVKKENSKINDVPICEVDIYVKCPYTEQPCEYSPGKDMKKRGNEILDLMKNRPKFYKDINGVQRRIRLPKYSDLCETCKHSNKPGKSTKSYFSKI